MTQPERCPHCDSIEVHHGQMGSWKCLACGRLEGPVIKPSNFAHACKGTCSGYDAGYNDALTSDPVVLALAHACARNPSSGSCIEALARMKSALEKIAKDYPGWNVGKLAQDALDGK